MSQSPRDAALTTLKSAFGVAVALACAAAPAQAATSTIVYDTPGEHAVVVPAGVTSLGVVAVGGVGGAGDYRVDGGFGARVSGDLAVTPGSTIYLVVGGNGSAGTNHGGAGGGGGASDVRTLPVSAGLTPTDSRLLIAGGGGGSGRGYGMGAGGSAGIGGNGNTVGGESRQGSIPASGGGAPGVPTGTGLGGSPGGPGGGGASGAAGTFGVGGAGAYVGTAPTIPAPGGYNGGGIGGGYSSTVVGQTFQYYGGGGGGGGLNGGGGGGGVVLDSGTARGGGGGGGGSNRVPAGGSSSTGTTRAGSISISFPDNRFPVVSLDPIPARMGSSDVVTGESTTEFGDGNVTINVYAGTTATGQPVASSDAHSRDANGRWYAALPSVPDGQHTMQARQLDGAGNTAVSVARTFIFDGTEPTVSITSPADGSVTNDRTPQLAGVAGTAVGDAATVDVAIYGPSTLVAFVTGPRDGTTGAYSFPTSPALADGTYSAVTRQADSFGHTGISSYTHFTVDATAPAPTVTSPASARTADTTPTFAGTGTRGARDESTVVVRVFAGTTTSGSPVATLDDTLVGGQYEVAVTAPLADGTYTAQTEQSDTAGNTGRSAPLTFTVDTTAPVVSLAAPSGGTTPTFTGTAGTATGDLAAVAVTVRAGAAPDGPLVATFSTTRDATTGAFSVTSPSALPAGTYSAQAAQADDLGNTAASAARTFTVADTPPIDTPPIVTPPIVTPPATLPTPPSTTPEPTPPTPAGDRQAPTLSKLSLTPARFRVAARPARLPRGTVLRYRLSEPATVTVTITRSGRSAILGTLTRRSPAGAARLAVSGRFRGKPLPPGRYRMAIRAADAAGNRSAAKPISFRVG